MSYHTEFSGLIDIDPPLNNHEQSYLLELAHTSTLGPHTTGRAELDLLCAWTVDHDGAVTTLPSDDTGSTHHTWLQWLIANVFGPAAQPIVDQHRGSDARLQHFTCDHIFNGEVHARGDEQDDIWQIIVRDNVVTTHYPLEEPSLLEALSTAFQHRGRHDIVDYLDNMHPTPHHDTVIEAVLDMVEQVFDQQQPLRG